MRNQRKIYSRYFTYIRPLIRLPIVKTYGITVFTFVVMTIFILFAIKPTIETILVLQKKLENSTEVLRNLQKKSQDLSAGRQNYENLDSAIKDRIHSTIPDSVELKTLIQTLETAARTHSASISAIQIEPQVLETKTNETVGNLSEVKFIFNVEGTYSNISSILEDIIVSNRLISVDSLLISKPAEGTGLVMSISGKAWYIK